MGEDISVERNAEWFANQNLTKYVGKWVAVVDRGIVAEGTDLATVLRKARAKAAGRTPYVAMVPDGYVAI